MYHYSSMNPTGTTCGICGKEFMSRRACSVHTTRIHGSSFSTPVRMDPSSLNESSPNYACPTCGRLFISRRGLANHRRDLHGRMHNGCAVTPTSPFFNPLNPPPPPASPNAQQIEEPHNVDFEEDPYNGPEQIIAEAPPKIDVTEYMHKLAERGTLDITFMLQYKRPDRRLSAREIETCRFLRATETGAGCSRRQVMAHLQYARSLEGRGALLPPGYKQLWKCIDTVRVSHCLKLYLFIPFMYI
jgi:hypothetical protein